MGDTNQSPDSQTSANNIECQDLGELRQTPLPDLNFDDGK
jgi:hypothetical protein